MDARRPLFLAVTTLLSIGLSIAAGEQLLRLAGHSPWTPALPPNSETLPVILEPDPDLGWRNKAGRFVWPGLGADLGRDIVMTFWPAGLRATAPERTPRRSRVVLLGGSFAQGWAVTDEETAGWQLQEALPQLEVLNFGTAGYGTLQSLLALERHLGVSPRGLDLVIYGFGWFHEQRNVASAAWLRAVSSTPRVGELNVPYATLAADGSLVRHPAEPVPAWPLRSRLALSAFVELRVSRLRTRERERQGAEVTEALVVELDRLVRAHGARLLIAVLSKPRPNVRRRHQALFRERGIAWVNCAPPGSRAQSMTVPGYGHPGRKANAYWASCIEQRVRETR